MNHLCQYYYELYDLYDNICDRPAGNAIVCIIIYIYIGLVPIIIGSHRILTTRDYTRETHHE